MTPPEAPTDGTAKPGNTPPAVSVCPPHPLPYLVETLRQRADFLAAARARRQVTPGFTLQARLRGPSEPPAPLIRIGFTASKKVGNAVARNRAKRRLRAIAGENLPTQGLPGWDYVLIARVDTTVNRPFADLIRDFCQALQKIHQPLRRKPGTGLMSGP